MIISRWIRLRITNVLFKIVEKVETRFVYSLTFFRKSCCLWDMWKDVVKPDRTQMTDGVHMHFMLDNKGYRQVLRMCNTFCFSATTMVMLTRPILTSIRTLPVLLLSSVSFVCLLFYLFLFLSFTSSSLSIPHFCISDALTSCNANWCWRVQLVIAAVNIPLMETWTQWHHLER